MLLWELYWAVCCVVVHVSICVSVFLGTWLAEGMETRATCPVCSAGATGFTNLVALLPSRATEISLPFQRRLGFLR